MAPAIIAVIGSLLGVALGYLIQYLQAERVHTWQVKDSLSEIKRQTYAEFLRSISASYAQSRTSQGNSEDANILKATAQIELLAGQKISKAARLLSTRVIQVHARLRENPQIGQKEVPEVDSARLELVSLFQADLGIRPGNDSQGGGLGSSPSRHDWDQPE